jgi:hypothetical protein
MGTCNFKTMPGRGCISPQPIAPGYGQPGSTFPTTPGIAPPQPAGKYLTPYDKNLKLNPHYPGAAYGAAPIYL